MRSGQRRRALALAILGTWAVLVAVHARREYGRPEAVRVAAAARSIAPGSQFYAARMGGRGIGMATSRLDTVPAGFLMEDLMSVDVPAQDTVRSAVVSTRVELGPALELRAFSFSLSSELGRFAVQGRAQGDSLLEVELRAGSQTERATLPLDESLMLASTLPLRLAATGGLKVGRSYAAPVLDPSVLETREVRVTVAAHDTIVVPDSVAPGPDGSWAAVTYDTVPVWRLDERLGAITVESWVDEDGRLVRAESPLGFALERTAWELARQDWHLGRADPALAAGYGAIIERTAIASNVRLDDMPARDRLSVRLVGVELGGFDLAGGRQELRGDTLLVEREAQAALAAGYALPYAGGGEAAAELGATPLIQTGDARIVAAAREAVGGTTDPVEAARRLNAWVHDALDKALVPSMPSAVQVLEGRRGDCNEHTVLYVALARALGLPSRTAVGLVHVQGRFYYHAWPEVWLDRWVAVDPTLGQFPADASHLRFLVGGLARQVELLSLVGRLELEVL